MKEGSLVLETVLRWDPYIRHTIPEVSLLVYTKGLYQCCTVILFFL